MYKDCLGDATSESKATIIDIFKELAEYSKTVPFLPFSALKTIVDEMVDKAHVFKLLVLKNKLAKFDRLGYFATNKQEVDSLKKFLSAKCTIIDLSELDMPFQNRYLEFIYQVLSEFDDIQVLLEMSNIVSKKNIKNILSDEKTSTTFITHSKFKYINDIKNVFDNFIILPSLSNNNIFEIYSTFLKFMPKKTYLISGENTNYIPLVSSLEIIDDVIEIVLDIGRVPEVRHAGGKIDRLNCEIVNDDDIVMDYYGMDGYTVFASPKRKEQYIGKSLDEIESGFKKKNEKRALAAAREQLQLLREQAPAGI